MNSAYAPFRTNWKQTWWTGTTPGKYNAQQTEQSKKFDATNNNDEAVAPATGAVKWNWAQWLIFAFTVYPLPNNGDTVELSRRAKVKYPFIPRMRQRDIHRWIFPRALGPIALHWALYQLSFPVQQQLVDTIPLFKLILQNPSVTRILGENALTGLVMNPIFCFVYYGLILKLVGIATVRMFRNIGAEVGYLDGEKQRDGLPDDSVTKIATSLLNTTEGRTLMVTMLAWSSAAPPTIDLWTILVKPTVFAIVLDFWFWCYHAAMHCSETLWKFHKTHHTARHPNTLLTLWADAEQEVFDIAVIPILTYLTMNRIPTMQLDFYSWFFCSVYIIVIEIAGHSGVRAIVTPPVAYGHLDKLNMDLIVEDHDLHHRQGWKKSGNYGKQTRIWDRLFGTCMERIESTPDKIDPVKYVEMPW